MDPLLDALRQAFSPEGLAASLSENQFLQGGAVLAVLSGTHYARALPRQLLSLARRRLTLEVQVEEPDMFSIVAEWMAAQPYTTRRCRRFAASLAEGHTRPTAGPPSPARTANGSEAEPTRAVTLSPGTGLHVFWHKGRPWFLSRAKDGEGKEDGMASLFRRYVITLHTYGMDASPVRELMEDIVAWDAARRRDEPGISVYANTGYDWRRVAENTSRSAESVVLAEGLMEDVLADAEGFWLRRDEYADLGIPFRRGHLYEGPPRNGKTSCAKAVASRLGVDIYALNLGSVSNDANLAGFVTSLPSKCVLLIEDVDAAFKGRSPVRRGKDEPGITFSALLNAIDGVAAQEGRLLILSTNHAETLDAALVGAGRIDRRFHFGYADASQAERMYLRFFPNEPRPAGALDAIDGASVSVAEIQVVLLGRRSDPAGAIAAVAALGARPLQLVA